MKNDNRIVQGLWIGGRLTELERLCIRSFCANGHEFHLYHYDDLTATYSVHATNSILGGIDKNATFSPNSPFEVLKSRYPEQ